MGENSKIEWTTHSWNPWLGCQKVSAGCDHCYAEALMDKRYHRVEWGPHGERKRTSAANWKLPLRWAKTVRATGERPRVFCASLADVFDNQAPDVWRSDLFALIEETPELDWLLLTKRPENIGKMLWPKWDLKIPSNIWLGTTCEDQAAFDRRWPILQQFHVRVRFISYEPAIGELTMAKHTIKPDWLICGGESGQGHRAMPAHWAYRIMDECVGNFVPFFFKQMAGKKPIPDDLLVRQFPMPLVPRPTSLASLGI
jgi:protein gp37